MNIKSGKFKKDEGPKPRNKYPWELLKEKDSYFKWPEVEDAITIRNAAQNQNFKVSVRKDSHGTGLYVIRVS